MLIKKIFSKIFESIDLVAGILTIILAIGTTTCDDKTIDKFDLAYISGIDDNGDYEYSIIPDYNDTVVIVSLIPGEESSDEYVYPIPFGVINYSVNNVSDSSSIVDLDFEIKSELRFCYFDPGYERFASRIFDGERLNQDSLFSITKKHFSKSELYNKSHIPLDKYFLHTDDGLGLEYNIEGGYRYVETFDCCILGTNNDIKLNIRNELFYYYTNSSIEKVYGPLLKKFPKNPIYVYRYEASHDTIVDDFRYKNSIKRVLFCKIQSINIYDVEQGEWRSPEYYNFNSMQKMYRLRRAIYPFVWCAYALFIITLCIRFVLILIYKYKHRKESLSIIYRKFYHGSLKIHLISSILLLIIVTICIICLAPHSFV